MLDNTEADVNGANMYANTCLMVAGYRGHLEIVRGLLAKGALVDIRVGTICQVDLTTQINC